MAVAAVGLIAAGCIPAGTHAVSSFGAGGVSRGLYRTLGSNSPRASTCNWDRRDSQGTVLGQRRFDPVPGAGLSATLTGPLYAEILPSDASFSSVGCVTFWKVPSPWSKPLATPGQAFGVGDFLVGSEVAPGTYTAPDAHLTFGCGWARVRDFRGAQSSVIEQGQTTFGETPTVTIAPADYGFSSGGGCGNWVKVA